MDKFKFTLKFSHYDSLKSFALGMHLLNLTCGLTKINFFLEVNISCWAVYLIKLPDHLHNCTLVLCCANSFFLLSQYWKSLNREIILMPSVWCIDTPQKTTKIINIIIIASWCCKTQRRHIQLTQPDAKGSDEMQTITQHQAKWTRQYV